MKQFFSQIIYVCQILDESSNMVKIKCICEVFGCVLVMIVLLPVNAEFKAVSRDQLGFKFMNFFHKPGTILTNSFITVHSNVTDISSCQLLCLDHRSCLSINVGKKLNQTTLDCELNNSTSLLKPLSLRKREGFDFYGLAEPCFSDPCLNGGICIPNMNEGTYTYHCNCLIQIPGLPYLDDHCTLDRSLLLKGGTFRKVYHLRIKSKRYPLNYYEAERACAIHGAKMSSVEQLIDAWRTGYDSCSYGWLIDGTARYPIYNQRTTSGCLGTGPPSIRGGSKLRNKNTNRYNVYCYRETDDCKHEDWIQNGVICYKFFVSTTATWSVASESCALEGATLGVFHTVNKMGFIGDFLQRKSFTGHILVGLRQDAGGTWKWTNGATVKSSLWNVTQPTGPIGTVNTDLKSLDKVPDTDQWKLPFVCQKPVP